MAASIRHGFGPRRCVTHSAPAVKSESEAGPVRENALAGRSFFIAGVELRLASDDPALGEEFARVFGGSIADPSHSVARVLTAEVSAGTGDWGEFVVTGDDLQDPASFLLGFASPTVPMQELAPRPDGSRVLTLEGSSEPLFLFQPDRCLFRKVPRWRRIVAHVLFLRMIRLRPEYRFFHAASLDLDGRGVMLIGPKGSGKSTISLALAMRGHTLYGDETAIFDPATQTILPMCRPVGIKPGPRSRAVEHSLRALDRSPDEDGMLRIPAELLVPRMAVEPAPLHDVIFLAGFGEEPAMERISPGREELSAMQPLRSSESLVPSTLQVFELIRLLGSVHCYTVRAAGPDATAELIEEKLKSCH